MRTHERKKVLMECEAMEAREIEVFILKLSLIHISEPTRPY